MAEMKEAKAEKRSYKKLSHVHLEAAQGGVIAHHRHSSNSTMMEAPAKPKLLTSHEEFMDHMAGVSKKMGLPEASAEEHEGPTSEVEAASEPASEDVNA